MNQLQAQWIVPIVLNFMPLSCFDMSVAANGILLFQRFCRGWLVPNTVCGFLSSPENHVTRFCTLLERGEVIFVPTPNGFRLFYVLKLCRKKKQLRMPTDTYTAQLNHKRYVM